MRCPCPCPASSSSNHEVCSAQAASVEDSFLVQKSGFIQVITPTPPSFISSPSFNRVLHRGRRALGAFESSQRRDCCCSHSCIQDTPIALVNYYCPCSPIALQARHRSKPPSPQRSRRERRRRPKPKGTFTPRPAKAARQTPMRKHLARLQARSPKNLLFLLICAGLKPREKLC